MTWLHRRSLLALAAASLATRAQDFRDFAVGNYKEAAQDIIATLTKQ